LDTTLAVSPERFEEGLTVPQYIYRMSKNRETFLEYYQNFTLRPEDVASIRALALDLKVLVLVEDWCGDVLRYLPVLARMAEAAGTWEVRVFYREANPDLAEVWLKEGKHRAIPVMVFFDGEMRELAHFIEKPAIVYGEEQRARQQFAETHPELPDASLPSAEMSEPTFALYADFIRAYRAESRKQWQGYFVEEIKGKLGREA